MSEPACPELWATIEAVGKAHLSEVAGFGGKMPESCTRVMHALCIIFKVTPEKHTETFPPGSGKKPIVHLLWGNCARSVLDQSKLRGFSPDLLSDAQREELGKVAVRAEQAPVASIHTTLPLTALTSPAGSC